MYLCNVNSQTRLVKQLKLNKVMEERKLDFENNKVQVLTLDELKQTYKETAPNGNPYNGVYHYEALEAVMNELGAICEPELQEIFAANNGDSRAPGVSVIRDLVPTLGEGALGVHTLRRVYANIDTHIEIDEGITLHVAFSYNQRGIMIGVGPHVHVCHNQTILRAEDLFSTYGAGAIITKYAKLDYARVMDVFSAYLSRIDGEVNDIKKLYQTLRSIKIDQYQAREFFGVLLQNRIRCDTRLKEISSPGLYALTQTQINQAMETWMKKQIDVPFTPMDGWSFLNCLNTNQKPDMADIPYLMPHMFELASELIVFLLQRVDPNHHEK